MAAAALQGEVIVEFQRVQTVRKRAKTHLRTCTRCGKKTDFISLAQAARLFEVSASKILGFVKDNSCHLETYHAGDIHICLPAFIAQMRDRSFGLRLTMSAPTQLEK